MLEAVRERLPATLLSRVRGTLLLSCRVPQEPLIETLDGEPGLNYRCAGYKAFFIHVDKPTCIMAELLRCNRAPAEVMLVLAAKEAHVQKAFAIAGRNEPSLCGSGRTFKHRHER